MEAFDPAPAARREMISFKVGAQEFCVDITAIREIRGWTPATPIPQAPSWVCGVINLRGAVMPVMDLGLRLGFSAVEAQARSVIIVAEVHGTAIGVLVDAVCETFTIDASALQTPPLATGGAASQFVSAIASMEERLVAVLNLAAILPAELGGLAEAA